MKSKSNVRFIFDKKGNKTGVLINPKDFEKLLANLEDLKDLALVYESRTKNYTTVPYEKLRKELFDAKK